MQKFKYSRFEALDRGVHEVGIVEIDGVRSENYGSVFQSPREFTNNFKCVWEIASSKRYRIEIQSYWVHNSFWCPKGYRFIKDAKHWMGTADEITSKTRFLPRACLPVALCCGWTLSVHKSNKYIYILLFFHSSSFRFATQHWRNLVSLFNELYHFIYISTKITEERRRFLDDHKNGKTSKSSARFFLSSLKQQFIY